MEYWKKDYRCWNKEGEDKCVNLYTCRLEDTHGTITNMDDKGLIYEDAFTFRAENPKEVKREEILKERIKCY